MFTDNDDSDSSQQDIGDTIIISNLLPETTADDVKVTFGYYGPIDNISFIKDTGKTTVSAVVKYMDKECAQLAYFEKQKRYIKGRLIQVSLPKKLDDGSVEPVEPPEDESVKKIIDTFCEFLVKSGNPDGFLKVTEEKQKDNPQFSFLFEGGENHKYFLWRRYCAKQGYSEKQIAEFVKQYKEGTPIVEQQEQQEEEPKLSVDNIPVGLLVDTLKNVKQKPYTPIPKDKLPKTLPEPYQNATLMNRVEAFYYALAKKPLSECTSIHEIEEEMEKMTQRQSSPSRDRTLKRRADRMYSYARY